ncbi:MAG: dUTP diphosphatase [Armatimonadetes bacterium]|nr:dUTP diphosphatase [Armatimonadota bacterium]
MEVVNPLTVRICRVPGTVEVPLPLYKTEGAVGMDIYAANADTVTVSAGGRAVIPTGFSIAVPDGYEAQVRSRSGLALRGIVVANSPGTVDADYRGEVQIILANHGTDDFSVSQGDRIAQLVIAPVMQVAWEAVDELPPTTRGAGGFGHTGRH